MGEIWGGLAAMLVALPSAIAFGLLVYSPLGTAYAAVGAMAGILGTIAIGIVTPIFGGTPRLISAPCAPAAAVLSALVLEFGGLPPDHILLLLMLVAVLSGCLQFLFGTVRGGRLIKYIPYPVVAGYLSGVGILIFLSQVPKLFGLPTGAALWVGLSSPTLWKTPGLIVGITTMVVMVLASRITRVVPAPILGLLGGILTYFGLSALYPEMLTLSSNPLVIGPISGAGGNLWSAFVDRWTAMTGLTLADLRLILIPALTLSVLLSIDTLKTCVVIDALTRSRSNSNRELIGQGLGNLTSAFAGGMPGAGTMGATLVNINSGAKTRRSSILEGVFALAAFVLFGGLVGWVPVAGLAGILIVVAYRMVDRNIFHLLKQKSTLLDFVVVAAVVVTAIVYNLIAAAGAGLGLAILLFLRERIRESVLRRKSYGNQTFSKKQRLPEAMALLEQKGAQTTICELQGSLFFGTTDQLFTELENDLKTKKYVILDMRRVQSVDFTAAHLLDQIEAQLAERHGTLVFSHLPPHLPTGQDLQTYFDQVGLVKPSRSVKIFAELDDALEWTEDRILEEAGLLQTEQAAPLNLHEINLLKGVDAAIVQVLASCVEERSYDAGQKIFRQGDAGDEIYLIRRGTIRIVLPLAEGREHHLVTFGRGDFFGDMAFIDRAVRSADAVACAPTDLYVISRARFDQVAMDYPLLDKKVFWRLSRALSIRLRQTDAELRALEES
ncbi:MAG: cyclic nucleotide-binding protein [Acidobacteria bacterium RIFCSPLOWO2_02_FULL_60_20]|nr:MAG: cyclic nucleotide-binding protein [Acidobacteria bacterium RIFCSPLOWO2_02_FULL_60_20]